jgi:hypothetical protein
MISINKKMTLRPPQTKDHLVFSLTDRITRQRIVAKAMIQKTNEVAMSLVRLKNSRDSKEKALAVARIIHFFFLLVVPSGFLGKYLDVE